MIRSSSITHAYWKTRNIRNRSAASGSLSIAKSAKLILPFRCRAEGNLITEYKTHKRYTRFQIRMHRRLFILSFIHKNYADIDIGNLFYVFLRRFRYQSVFDKADGDGEI